MAEYNLGTAHGTVKIDSDTTGVDNAGKSLDNLTNKGRNTGQALETVGSTMGVAGLAIAGGLGVAVATAASFEAEMSGIKAVSGATAGEMDKLTEAARRIGKESSFSATEAAQAMAELAKAGVSTSDILNGAADATVDLAAATGVSLPDAATIASNAMNLFNIEAKDMTGVVDTIAQTANASAIDVSDFQMAMSQAGGIAGMVGMSFDDLAVAIGEMGDMGYKGSDAGTSLKTAFLSLQPSTKEQINLFKDLGLMAEDGTNKFYDQEGKLKSLKDVQSILSDSLKGLTDAQRQQALETIFGTDAIRAGDMMARNGAKGYELFTEKQKATGSASEQAAIRQDNLKASLEKLMGSLQDAGISIGLVLIPPLRELAGWVETLFNWFGNLPGPIQAVITYFIAGAAGVLLLGAGIIKTVGFFSKLSEAITTLIPALARKNAAEAASGAASEQGAIRSAAAWVAAKLKMVGEWIAMAAAATVNAAKIAVIWIAETTRAAALTVAGWVSAAAKTVVEWAKMAAAATANAVKVTAIWAAETAKTILATTAAWAAAALKVAAQWAAMAAAATLNALKVAAAWLLQNGVAVATSLASLAVAVATTVGGWIAMAITATINAIIVAAAWLIAFWPIVLVVALVIGLAALIYIFWDEIVAAFKAAAAWIGEAMNAAWNWIKQAWDWILNAFQVAWDTIVSIFTAIFDFYVGIWKAIFDVFMQAGQLIWDAMKKTWEWIKGVWDQILGFLRQIPGWVIGVFSGALNWLMDAGKNILNGLWNGIKNVWNAVTGWFSQVGGWVKEKFSGALSWLVQAGGDLIRGLWNGISNVKDWIISKIGGFVDSVLSSIKSFFGISSPSKETAWMGEMLSRGLAEGITDNTRPAVQAAVSTATAVLEAMEKAMAEGASLEAAIGTSLTPGALASLKGAAPTLAARLDGMAGSSGQVRASDTQAGTDAAFQKIVKMEFNTYNPVAEKASDNEARKIRAAAAVGAF